MKTKVEHPDWVLSQKRPKTEVRFLNGRYYLYSVSSKWDKETKRSKKITGPLLGRITPDGFVESSKNKLRTSVLRQTPLSYQPSVKTYGFNYLINTQFESVISKIKESFPLLWQDIVSLSMLRMAYQSPIKNCGSLFENSYLSEEYKDIRLGEKRVSALYRKLGSMRSEILSYFTTLTHQGENLLIDATNIISYSNNIGISHLGYNSKQEYEPQINLMLMFSSTTQSPVYYRVIPGNIREVTAFKTTLNECGNQNVTIIADKGFYSESNIETLDNFKSKYIIPLRRNNTMVDYTAIEQRKQDGYFKFQNKYLWYNSYDVADGKRVHLFLDNVLMGQEEKDYLSRIESHPEDFSYEEFLNKKNKFGTIALYTNELDKTSEQIFLDYKTRNEVEMMIDVMKNTLKADVSYMQNEDAFNGWMFINFVATQLYYKIYKELKTKALLKKYSPKDVVMYLEQVRIIKTSENKWILSEVNAKTKKILSALKWEHITY